MRRPVTDLTESGVNFRTSSGLPRCRSISVQTNMRCGRSVVLGSDRCYAHVPRYDSAIKSESLREKYQRLKKDTELRDQNDDLALLRAFCEVMIEKATDAESVDSLSEMTPIQIAGITNMLQQIDRLIASITRREERSQFVVHARDIAALVERMTEIVVRHVKDPELITRICNDLTSVAIPAAQLPPPDREDDDEE